MSPQKYPPEPVLRNKIVSRYCAIRRMAPAMPRKFALALARQMETATFLRKRRGPSQSRIARSETFLEYRS